MLEDSLLFDTFIILRKRKFLESFPSQEKEIHVVFCWEKENILY